MLTTTTSNASLVPRATLSDGRQMPLLGFGTSGISPNQEPGANRGDSSEEAAYAAIKHAVRCGYRFFDTAALYENEQLVGRALNDAIREQLVTREELFVCTKVWNTAHKRRSVVLACQESLNKLKLDYIDLYLIHWPMAYLDRFDQTGAQQELINLDGCALNHIQDRLINPRHPSTAKLIYSRTHFTDTWLGMEDAKEAGLVRSVGVSNFTCAQLDQLLQMAHLRHPPTVNQIEMHPYLAGARLLEHARRNNILINAYCPLGAPGASWCPAGYPVLMEEPLIGRLAEKYSRTRAQVILEWHLMRGVAPIPKSVTPSRIEENMGAVQWLDTKFELSADDREALLGLDCNRRYCQTTANERVTDHPLFPHFDL